MGWLVLRCVHVQGWPLLVYTSALNVTVGVTQTDWSKQNLDPFWMGLVMTFNPATLNIEISATGQDVNLIYLF